MTEPVLAPIPQCVANTQLYLDCDTFNHTVRAVLGVQTPGGEKAAAFLAKN